MPPINIVRWSNSKHIQRAIYKYLFQALRCIDLVHGIADFNIRDQVSNESVDDSDAIITHDFLEMRFEG